jgi:multiple sugar transport system substrate-binding protein
MRQRTWRTATCAALALALVVAVAACSSAAPGGTASTAPGGSGTGEKVTLQVVVDAYHEPYFNKFKEQFETTHGDIDVKILPYAFEEIAQKQLLELSQPSGGYDVVSTVPSWFSQYVGADLLEPLDGYINDPALTDAAAFDVADFVPAILDAARRDDKLYGFSIALFPQVMFYREDLLKKHGLEVPKTLDELLAAVKATTVEGETYGYVYNGQKGGVGAVGWNWFPYLFTFGGEILDKDGKPAINSPAAVKALEYYIELAKYAAPEAISYSWEAALEPMQQGKAAFSLTDFDAWRPFSEVTEFPIEVAPFPTGPDGEAHVLLGNWSVHIAKNSQHKKEAWEWIEFISSKDAMETYLEFGELPARISALTSPELAKKYPAMAVAYDAMKDGRGLPATPEYGKVEDEVVLAVTEAMTGSKTPQQALDDAQARLLEIVGQ